VKSFQNSNNNNIGIFCHDISFLKKNRQILGEIFEFFLSHLNFDLSLVAFFNLFFEKF
jgi:hypothetical protein